MNMIKKSPKFYLGLFFKIYFAYFYQMKTITISKKEIIKADKTRHRDELISYGLYNIFRNQTFKDKKSYSRKDKHKKLPI